MGWFQSDSDVEWIMMASSSNSGTPPKLPSIKRVSHIPVSSDLLIGVGHGGGGPKVNFSLKG